ncbi:hypothetical protein BCR42DRAFT_405428, partial [Absidia repens]
MFSISLAPTSAPKRWYSNQHSVQNEYEELAYLEAKFVHDREQALEVRCPMIVPPSTFNNTSLNTNNNNSMGDPSMDDMEAQDDINDSSVTPYGEVDVTFMNDPPYDTDHQQQQQQQQHYHDDAPDPNTTRSLSFMSQHDSHSMQLPPQQYHGSSTYTSSMLSSASFSTPNRTIAPHLPSNFFNTPTPTTTQQRPLPPQTSTLSTSPDIDNYLSPPPPAGRSLRQYMDDSSRGFMEPEIMDRLIHYDDDDDNNNNNDPILTTLDDYDAVGGDDDVPRRMRRSRLF